MWRRSMVEPGSEAIYRYSVIHANTGRRPSLNTTDQGHLPVGQRLWPQLGHIERPLRLARRPSGFLLYWPSIASGRGHSVGLVLLGIVTPHH
jgi:hypothetical protein